MKDFKVVNLNATLTHNQEKLFESLKLKKGNFIFKFQGIDKSFTDYKFCSSQCFLKKIKSQDEGILLVKNVDLIAVLKKISSFSVENILLFPTALDFDFNFYLYNNEYLEDENILKYNLSDIVVNISNKEKETYIISKS